MHRTPVIAAVLVLTVLVGACSQQKDPTVDELRDDISEQLQEIESPRKLTAEQADCFATKIVRDKGDVEDLVDVKFSAEEPSDEMADDIAAAAVAARDECGITGAP